MHKLCCSFSLMDLELLAAHHILTTQPALGPRASLRGMGGNQAPRGMSIHQQIPQAHAYNLLFWYGERTSTT